ncbi:hypothetical protein ACP70R_048490 [Stipagrostis hirtigluma subsp. patula]
MVRPSGSRLPHSGEDDVSGCSCRVTRSRAARGRRVDKSSSADVDVESESDGDGKHISHRFSTSRVVKLVTQLKPVQKHFITKNGFGVVLDIPKFRVPVPFLEWLMEHTFATSNEFIYKDKRIQFTRDMVVKVFGIPSGTKPVEVSSPDFQIDALVDGLKAEYKVGRTYPISKCIQLVLSEVEDELKFMRHFMLFLISSILIPGKANDTCVEYLYSLVDMTQFKEYDWAEQILYVLMCEVHRFHSLRDCLGRSVARKHFWMEGCLPFLAIVYADFLDLPQQSRHVHGLNYNLPRISHFSTADFLFVMEIDKDNHGPRHHFYGVQPFRDISCTPYRTVEPKVPHNISQNLDHLSGANAGGATSGHAYAGPSFENNLDVPSVNVNGSGPIEHQVSGNAVSAGKVLEFPSVVIPDEARAKVLSDVIQDVAKSFAPAALGNSSPLTSGVGFDSGKCFHQISPKSDCAAGDCQFDVVDKVQSPTEISSSALPVEEDVLKCQVEEDVLKSPAEEDVLKSPVEDVLKSPAEEDVLKSAAQEDMFKSPVVDVGEGLMIAMNYGDESPVVQSTDCVGSLSLGPSTIDLKNRKKRTASDLVDLPPPLVIEVDDVVESFYLNFVRKVAYKKSLSKHMPPFVDVTDFHLTYEEFRDSFKPNSKLGDRAMAVYSVVFNGKPAKYLFDKSDRKKIVFGPTFTKKLLVNPSLFQSRSCIGELRKAHSLFKLNTVDLMFFPVLLNDHWTLICINKLFSKLHYFDSADITSDIERMMRTLGSNLTCVCAEANIVPSGFNEFESLAISGIPKQKNLHDCGFYMLLYLDGFDGKNVRHFVKEAAVQYRKIAAYKLYYSPLNKTNPPCSNDSPVKDAKKLKKN